MVSNFDDIKERFQRASSNKLSFDPKNLIIENKAKLEELYEFCGRVK